jgi:hypothetical protein
MLAGFCLRLACGLVGALVFLPAAQVNPRFYRVHFLTVLGLAALAAVFLRDLPAAQEGWLWLALGIGMFLAFLGSLSWSLERAPAGRAIVYLTTASFLCCLVLNVLTGESEEGRGWLLANDLISAALLGAATTSMLVGHFYLIAPSMSLTPLLRLLGGLFAALAARATLSAAALWFWTTEGSAGTLSDILPILPVRWGLGILGPLVLGAMAWQTARIRSTQSATGILYVVVIFAFLGELMGQLLLRMTHLAL